ncbi:hypothetical protein FHW23_000863 [Curtobacterium pusillum]|uniref:Htaa domain-containing protein n=1 Tax=Curtobacterium pusillum TaxID=69373 RepID=A0AAW3T364_9MICO|nr:hypothetical protein [Curtobacterium pusillum]MBA8989631.1 hypothetical protein [Curtobacterium pusillum]
MKRSRIMTVAAATAVVAGSTFFSAGMATAAPDSSSATWVNTTADLGQETTAGYPTTGWFYGDTAPATSGVAAFSPNGVTLTGPTQLLTATSEPGVDLQDLVTSADFISTGSVDFQIPMFLNTGGATGADTNFTTLRPADFGDGDLVDGNGRWISSAPVGTIPADTAANLSDFEAQITATSPNAEIIGYGFITPAASTGTVRAVQFGGDTTYFTPTPAGTYQPTSSTVTEVTTDGVHVIGSGFFPGETVDVGFVAAGSQSGGPIDGLTLTADANGAIDAQLVIPASAVPGAGTYTLALVGEASGIFLTNQYVVTADPSTPVTATPVPTAPVPTPVRTAATFAG